MNENLKDLLIRAAHTFWQAAVAYLVANIAAVCGGVSDAEGFKSAALALLVGVVGAGLSAIKTMAISTLGKGDSHADCE